MRQKTLPIPVLDLSFHFAYS